jgi:DNA-binding transcriptional regulator YdaS (Cro superfamily)
MELAGGFHFLKPWANMRHMDIRTYLSQADRGAGVALARAIGVHPVMVSQWASGQKAVAVERCAAIERATDGQVKRWSLRPADWHLIWPELIGIEGAPEIPTQQAA